MIHVQSHFSLGLSTLDTDEIVEAAKKEGHEAVFLADTMTVSAMIDFTKKCRAADIKPIVGVRLRIADDTKVKEKDLKHQPYELKVYPTNLRGMQAIYRLLTLAYSEERFYYNAKLLLSDVLNDADLDALVITFSDAHSVFLREDAREIIEKISARTTRSQRYAELCPIDSPVWDKINARAIEWSDDLDYNLIATRLVRYLRDGADSLETLSAITANNKLSDPWHHKPFNKDLCLIGQMEFLKLCVCAKDRIEERFPDLDQVGRWTEAFNTAVHFHKQTWFEWSEQEVSLPSMADDEFAALVDMCKNGWKRRFSHIVFGEHRVAAAEVYRDRLAYELDVIRRMKFSGYFLLVSDIVNWSKINDILVGPGRGSVGGSLVAYLCGITDVDPIRFGLIFERFINPDRIDLPDADLDFMSARRHEVIQYMVDTYGADRVAGISNYATLASASALRDTGRVNDVDPIKLSCTKLVPSLHGNPLSLEDAAKEVPDIQSFSEEFPDIWKTACSLQGKMRNFGRHAAGVVVSGVPLVERAVVERRKNEATINWDKRTSEDNGLVKIDILGLSTLDVIGLATEYIEERYEDIPVLTAIPLDDRDVLSAFAKGDTTGIFQFESAGMRRLLSDIGAEGITFEDIAAATALYRPGPMDSGMMDSFVARKAGYEAIEYDHPNMMRALKETYGVIVYQEQVMQLARDLAGFSMTESDHLRKAMGKKLPEEMAKYREQWVNGCVETSAMAEKVAESLFDAIEAFAGYGFNKSHAVEYSLISYQTMYLKVYYPVEFFAAALSVMKEDKLEGLLRDAKDKGITVRPPEINTSTDRFEIMNDTTLCAAFDRVKGISSNTAQAILKAREAGPFESMDDLRDRVERRRCNVRHMEHLNKVGAFSIIEEDQPDAMDPCRLKDQMELMPGLMTEVVEPGRDMITDPEAKKDIVRIVNEYRAVSGAIHPRVRLGKRAKFMVITDCPTWSEEKEDKMASGMAFQYISEALGMADLDRNDAYWTALCKKPKADKVLSNDEINTYSPFLLREIEVLKPPLIVALGTSAAKFLVKDLKGPVFEHAGKVIFDSALDANIVVGFNPAQIAFDDAKQSALNDLFGQIAEILEK